MKKKVKLVLKPEHDFLENSEYLKDLVKRVSIMKKVDTINDEDFLQEIIQADYYINRLLRLGDFNKEELEEMSTIFKGVLDTVQSKKVSSSHNEEDEIKNNDYSHPFRHLFILCVSLICISVILYLLFNGELYYIVDKILDGLSYFKPILY